MNDRELLTLAAKAAGLHIYHAEYLDGRLEGLKIFARGEIPPPMWNPLTDDGDALRLAVKLGLKVICGPRKAVAANDDASVAVADDMGQDPYAATRSAIVRAAAEIGKVS